MKNNNFLLTSFIKEATASYFPIQNLPYGVFSVNGNYPHIGTAIGPYILDLTCLEEQGLLIHRSALFNTDNLNKFAASGPTIWSTVRNRIQTLLSALHPELRDNDHLLSMALIPQQQANMHSPFKIEGFSDFYASLHHATNVGRLFRGNETPLLPNWKHLPVGYNGRASTIFLSGTKIQRPKGQIKHSPLEAPVFKPSQKLDFELEMGIFIGVGNPNGNPISTQIAKSHIFGLVLLNDWSARDIQAFEYQPLGPFLSKSFATSISPWVVSLAALEDFMTPLPHQQPIPVDYLKLDNRLQPDIKLTVELLPKGSTIKTILCETNYKELYWTMEQMLAHHTINRCIMKPGDLLGSGTISGPTKENWGSLLEITANGMQALDLKDGNSRTFLEDGDTIIMTGYCESPYYKIGFGYLDGTILAAE